MGREAREGEGLGSSELIPISQMHPGSAPKSPAQPAPRQHLAPAATTGSPVIAVGRWQCSPSSLPPAWLLSAQGQSESLHHARSRVRLCHAVPTCPRLEVPGTAAGRGEAAAGPCLPLGPCPCLHPLPLPLPLSFQGGHSRAAGEPGSRRMALLRGRSALLTFGSVCSSVPAR